MNIQNQFSGYYWDQIRTRTSDRLWYPIRNTMLMFLVDSAIQIRGQIGCHLRDVVRADLKINEDTESE